MFEVASATSKANALMDWDGMLSVSGVQCGCDAVASSDFHTPPFTDPTYKVFGLVGCANSASIAPTMGLLAIFSTWPVVADTCGRLPNKKNAIPAGISTE